MANINGWGRGTLGAKGNLWGEPLPVETLIST